MNTPKAIEGLIPVEFTPLSIARMVWKHKPLVVSIWVAATLITYFLVRRMPATYTAEALISIESPKVSEQYIAPAVRGDPQDRLNMLSQQILSTVQLIPIIEDFGLYGQIKGGKIPQSAVERLRQDIRIRTDRRESGSASAFRVSYTGSSSGTVSQVSNRIANLFIERNLHERQGQVQGTSEFLEEQLRNAKRNLEEMEGALSRYKLSHNGELPQQLMSLTSTIDRLQGNITANREATTRAEQLIPVLEANLANAEAIQATQAKALESAAVVSPAAPDGASSRPAPVKRVSDDLQLQLSQLQLLYGDGHPDVRRLTFELERVRKLEAKQQERAAAVMSEAPKAALTTGSQRADVNRERIELQRAAERVSAIKAQIAELKRDLENRKTQNEQLSLDMANYQGRVNRLPVREQELSQVTRDYDISLKNYQSLLDKKLAAGMAGELERGQKSERFTMIEPARILPKLASRNRIIVAALGSLGGVLIGLLLALAIELRKGQFLGEWELPVGVPVLGRLPYIGAVTRTRGRWLFGMQRRADSLLPLAVAFFYLHRT